MNIKQIVQKLTDATRSKPEDGLIYLRERVFNTMLLVIMGVAFFAYLLSVYNAVSKEAYIQVAVDTFGYIVLGIAAFSKKIGSLRVRFLVFVYLSLLLGILYLILNGPYGAGFLYIVGFNIFSAIFFDKKGVIRSMILSLVVMFGLYMIIYFDLLPDYRIHLYTGRLFLIMVFDVLMFSSVAVGLAFMVDNQDRILKQSEKLKDDLYNNLKALSIAKQKAEESENLKSSFLANMSHEIRTPLNAIIGFSDLVINQPDISIEDARFYNQTINKSGQYLMKIIDDVLDVSLLDAKQVSINLSDIDIRKLFSDIETLYESRTEKKNDVDILFDFPSDKEAFVIKADEVRLKQVIINLINNALKFTRNGEIKVGFTVKENEIEFYVSDTGKGIPEDKIELIFNRFVKSETDNKISRTKGAGLGLAISKGLVELWGGKIWAESEDGKGSVFHFTLPFNRNQK